MKSKIERPVQSERELMERFGGSGKMSIALRMLQPRVCNWMIIGIPVQSWPDIFEAAKREGIPGITFDLLYELRKRRQKVLGDLASLHRRSA